MLPRLLWPLLVYEVPVSTVEGLESKLNTYLKEMAGFPKKRLLYRPVQYRQRAPAANNICGGRVQGNKNTPDHDATV